jgi:tripeptide aminopeptidase
MSDVLERFLRYVRIDTQSHEGSDTVPSTLKQLELSRLLERECRELGLVDVELSEHGVLYATVPANVPHSAPVVAFNAHVDTSPETSGTGVKPQVIRGYAGGDIVLPGNPSRVIRVAENPELDRLIGETLITTDGTTLLGADDKAGVAAIMAAAAWLVAHPDVPHGPVRLCFTCDEEIGHGVDHVDLAKLGAVCAYTLDGDGAGGIDAETFSADQAVVTVTGINIHPSIGKGKLVNAIRILADFLSRLPTQSLSPETTEGREGFVHPYIIEGGVAQATAKLLLRDFDTPRLAEYAKMLEQIADELRARHPKARIEIAIRQQYRNLGDGLKKEPRALALAEAATRAAGLEPRLSIIRGGTDGSRFTELGLPTPNLSTGEHNPHSPLEWTCEKELEAAVRVIVELARLWGRERV